MIKKAFIIVFGVVCGAVAAQAPEFMQQYTQRLGGWLDGYSRLVSKLEEDVKQFNMTSEEYIAALRTSTDPKSVVEANRLANLLAVHKKLEDMQTAFNEAPAWKRGLVFVQNMENSLLQATYGIYKPAVPTTAEGAAYGGAGFVAGAILLNILMLILGQLRRLLGGGVDMVKRRRGGGKKINI